MLLAEREGGNKKGSVLENAVNTEAILFITNDRQVNTGKTTYTARYVALILFLFFEINLTLQ